MIDLKKQQIESLFVPGLLVDIPNYIAELIIFNKLKRRKEVKPNCAFWRKDIVVKMPKFQHLAQDYTRELTYIKKLLVCFSPKVLIDHIKERNVYTFFYQKLHDQHATIYTLWRKQCVAHKDQQKPKRVVEKITSVDQRKTPKNKLSGLF